MLSLQYLSFYQTTVECLGYPNRDDGIEFKSYNGWCMGVSYPLVLWARCLPPSHFNTSTQLSYSVDIQGSNKLPNAKRWTDGKTRKKVLSAYRPPEPPRLGALVNSRGHTQEHVIVLGFEPMSSGLESRSNRHQLLCLPLVVHVAAHSTPYV